MAKPKSAAKKPAAKKSKGSSRRRAAPTKEETVETSTGVQLLLGNMPSDKDALSNLEILMNLIDRSHSAAARVTDHKKKMREMGFDITGMTNTIRLMRLDPIDLAAELKEQQRLMRLKGLPVQMALFEPKYGSPEAQAKALGYRTGRAGKSVNAELYPDTSPYFETYLAAWTEGQKDMIEKGALKDDEPEEEEEEEDAGE
jgi:hypothetical protein